MSHAEPLDGPFSRKSSILDWPLLMKSGIQNAQDSCFRLSFFEVLARECFSCLLPTQSSVSHMVGEGSAASGDPQIQGSCSQQGFVKDEAPLWGLGLCFSLWKPQELLCNGIGQATIVDTSALWVFPELLRTAALHLVIQCVSRLKFFPVSLHLVKANKCTTWCSYKISIESLATSVQSILISFDKIQTLLTSFSFVIWIAFWITTQLCALTLDNICTELKVMQ